MPDEGMASGSVALYVPNRGHATWDFLVAKKSSSGELLVVTVQVTVGNQHGVDGYVLERDIWQRFPNAKKRFVFLRPEFEAIGLRGGRVTVSPWTPPKQLVIPRAGFEHASFDVRAALVSSELLNRLSRAGELTPDEIVSGAAEVDAET
jgi:hypothetical protein